ncbi:hypothetical protein AMJ47_03425 [Parcubacteria bacterium DG_72]|nr:MAG: hypothetical protein AMJ47_03425 [Parcubacteria bacterium DG_72]
MVNNNFKKFVFGVLLLLFIASPVLAQEFNYPNLPGAEAPQDFLTTAAPEDIPGLWVKYVINLLTWAAGMIAFLALLWGGIKFLTSTGKPDRITEARKQISSAFLGLAIILTAYFVLEKISPYFIDFTLPDIEDFSLIKVPSPPSEQSQKSSIDSYIPFGRIIENIFQTYISNPEEAQQTSRGPVVPATLTRIQRITNILDTTGMSNQQTQTNQILPEILRITDEIRNLTGSCSCSRTWPDPFCSASCGWGCPPLPPLCTCDPCSSVRGNIVNLEEELQPWFFEDINDIVQHDAYGNTFTIATNLTREITRLEEEVRLLKIWFDRLARAQQSIEDCDWFSLNNRNQFFQKKDEFEAKGWVIEDVAFYDDLEVVLNVPVNPRTLEQRWYPRPGTRLEQMADESTLYCAVGGTYARQPSDFKLGLSPPDPFEGLDEDAIEDALEGESFFTYEMACDITVPFGEILDKAHRMARLLINKLELILDREKRIVETAGDLQELVSQCSSRRCVNICICIPPTPFTPPFCLPLGCHGNACPSDIEDKADAIQRYGREIQEAINGIGAYATPDQIGINQIFNDLVPDLLQGMQDSLRNHMTKCTFEREVGADVVLYTCKEALGGTNEIGKIIRQCDYGTNDQWQDTLYGGCLNNCLYSKISETPSLNPTSFFEETEYRYCVNDCMASACIYNYNHVFNFHCCHYKL